MRTKRLSVAAIKRQLRQEFARSGGQAYARNHTAAERSAAARRAVNARWKKKRIA